jgi:hypothetical protein
VTGKASKNLSPFIFKRFYPEITVDNFCCYFIHRCANFYWHGCLFNDTVDIYSLRLWRTLSAGKMQAASLATLVQGLAWLYVPAESPPCEQLTKNQQWKYNIAFIKNDSSPHFVI